MQHVDDQKWPSDRAITEATEACKLNTRALATSTDAPPTRRVLTIIDAELAAQP